MRLCRKMIPWRNSIKLQLITPQPTARWHSTSKILSPGFIPRLTYLAALGGFGVEPKWLSKILAICSAQKTMQHELPQFMKVIYLIGMTWFAWILEAGSAAFFVQRNFPKFRQATCTQFLTPSLSLSSNLGSKTGLAVLGTIKHNNGEEISMDELDSTSESTNTNSVMAILRITSNPNGIELNFEAIVKWFQRLSCMQVCFLSKCCETFCKIDFTQPKPPFSCSPSLFFPCYSFLFSQNPVIEYSIYTYLTFPQVTLFKLFLGYWIKSISS